MNNLTIISSGSIGNAYILEADNDILLLECGVNMNTNVFPHVSDMTKVKGVLVSHKHTDHAEYINQCYNSGINIYSCQEVVDKYPKAKLIKPKTKIKLGNFYIQALPVNHSCECYAFLIEHKSIGRCLFATDLTSFDYKVKNINHIFIEANYSEDIIVNNACNDNWSSSASNTHMEINDTIKSLKNNYSSSLQTVVLLHLSSGNSNAKLFRQMVIDSLCMDNVYIAKKDLIIDLNKEEF